MLRNESDNNAENDPKNDQLHHYFPKLRVVFFAASRNKIKRMTIGQAQKYF